jgi:hypothetical protein
VPNGWNIPKQLAIRASTDPLSLAPDAQEAIWAVDRDQPISEVRTMDDVFDLAVADHKRQTRLLGSFAILALVLASLGITESCPTPSRSAGARSAYASRWAPEPPMSRVWWSRTASDSLCSEWRSAPALPLR